MWAVCSSPHDSSEAAQADNGRLGRSAALCDHKRVPVSRIMSRGMLRKWPIDVEGASTACMNYDDEARSE